MKKLNLLSAVLAAAAIPLPRANAGAYQFEPDGAPRRGPRDRQNNPQSAAKYIAKMKRRAKRRAASQMAAASRKRNRI